MKKMKRKISTILCIVIMLSMFSLVSFAEALPSYYGDVNQDGNITSSDARKILRVSAMLETLSDDEFKFADINKDGKITSSDARKTLRVAAMLDEKIEIKNTGIIENEKDIVEKIGTFVPYDEFAEKNAVEDVLVFKNLTNNIIITDERTEKNILDIKADYITEGEYKGNYKISITDKSKEKTYDFVSDNKYVIVFSIADFGSAAVRYLSYTNVDDFVIDENDTNVELLGFWIDFGGEITFPERDPVQVTESNIKNVTSFKEYPPNADSEELYPNAKFLLNDAKNVLIIDERTNKEPIQINNCTIGLDEWNEEELVFKMTLETKNKGEHDTYDFEVGETQFAVVTLADYGYGCMATTFSFAEDYVIIP